MTRRWSDVKLASNPIPPHPLTSTLPLPSGRKKKTCLHEGPSLLELDNLTVVDHGDRRRHLSSDEHRSQSNLTATVRANPTPCCAFVRWCQIYWLFRHALFYRLVNKTKRVSWSDPLLRAGYVYRVRLCPPDAVRSTARALFVVC